MNSAKSIRQLLLVVLLTGCTMSPVEAGAGSSGDGGESAAPRNVILFLGDGMGVSTVTAARILAGQQQGKMGEEHVLSFETFPNVALVKTYNVDSQVGGSGATMSAIMTGEKSRIGTFGVSEAVEQNDCVAALANELPSLLEQAEDRGFATGVVSTARITHATPAATYSHTPSRNWEADSALPEAAVDAGCRDIARQLVEFDHGDGPEVVLGGGRAVFLPSNITDPEYPRASGQRKDGQNLIETWLAGGANRQYVWNQAQFQQLPDDGPVLGLFEPSHMQFEADRDATGAGEPSIAEMTAFAIQRLAKSEKGFFLMVEGGRIDHAHHGGNAYRALTDAVAMAEAVQVAMDLTDEANTLIMVTADHSHTLTISAYPRRGNPILGKLEPAPNYPATDARGLPYTTLSYANGPGYKEELPDLTDVDTEDPNYLQVAGVPMTVEMHGGEDVAAYARGPNADTLRGVVEQNELYFVLRGALFGEE